MKGGIAVKNMSCREIVQLLMAFFDGETDSETTRAVDRHLSRCRKCQAVVNTYRRTVQLLSSLRVEEIPAEFSARLLARVRAHVTHAG
jgi:anti-sigma factor RsiW